MNIILAGHFPNIPVELITVPPPSAKNPPIIKIFYKQKIHKF